MPSESEIAAGVRAGGRKIDVSRFQAALFDMYPRERRLRHGDEAVEGDLWTHPNGKRWFQFRDTPEFAADREAGEVIPSGPMFGYKVPTADYGEEDALLARVGLAAEDFRVWGKRAKGARRPLRRHVAISVRPGQGADQAELTFALTSGTYATVLLIALLDPALLEQPCDRWPNPRVGHDFARGADAS